MILNDWITINYAFLFSMSVVLLFLISNRTMERNIKMQFLGLCGLAVLEAVCFNLEMDTVIRVSDPAGEWTIRATEYLLRDAFYGILLLMTLRKKRSEWIKRLLPVPWAVEFLALLFTCGNGLVFRIGSQGEYIPGPFFLVTHFVSCIYLLVLFLVALAKGKSAKRECAILLLICVFNIWDYCYELWLGDGGTIRITTTALTIVGYYMYFRSTAHLGEKVKAVLQKEEEQKKLTEELQMQTVMALINTIETKDPYTRGHSVRVAAYARLLAALSGKNEETCKEIYFAGLIHDIGKIGVAREIINKPSSLEEYEIELSQKHPEMGANILSAISQLPMLREAAYYHHEFFDGNGYPCGLKGEEIPEIARLIAVADSYDAMTSKRSYRDVLPQETVRKEIQKGIGTQFDPYYANLMLQLIDEDKEYQMREGGKREPVIDPDA